MNRITPLSDATRQLLQAPREPQGPVPIPLLSAPTAALFAALARLRQRRSLHPRGAVHEATLRVAATPGLPAAWRALDGAPAVLRFSRSVGLPRPFPDILGIAMRAGGQDLLYSSSGRGAVLQHLLVPGIRLDRRTYSSIFLHRVSGRRVVLTATTDGPRIHLEAVTLGGRRAPLGLLEVGAQLHGEAAARVRFDPWRTGGDLVPAGFLLQRLRSPAYWASRRGAAR